MKPAAFLVALALIAPTALAAPVTAQTVAATVSAEAVQSPPEDTAKKRPALSHYNVDKKGLALEGRDPVAYFPEFGGKAVKGDKKITTTHAGVTYRFKSEANRKAFLANPAKFEPAYGGWCSWAMYDGKGDKVEADPDSFTVENGRLHVFYDGFFNDTRKSWKKKGGAPKLAAGADKNWKRISGEDVPVVKKPKEKKPKDNQ